MTEQLTLTELEQYLARAADLLRGSIDHRYDLKAYIFPLMFSFKRISDVYLEEFAQALEESGGDHEFASFAENHRFAIPAGNLWSDVREKTENIGTALQTAFREIEKANPETLYGIFGNANWINKDKLPDRKLSQTSSSTSRRRRSATLTSHRMYSVTPTSTSSSGSQTSRTRRPASTTPRAQSSAGR